MKVLVVPTWYPCGEDKLMGIYHKEYTCALNKYGIEANMLFIERSRLSKPLSYILSKKKVVDKEENYKVYFFIYNDKLCIFFLIIFFFKKNFFYFIFFFFF